MGTDFVGSLTERASILLKSENGKLVICALAASIVTAGSIYGFQATDKVSRARILRQTAVQHATAPHETIQLNSVGGPAKQKNKMDEDVIMEQLSRNYLFFGEEGMEKIRRSFVIVVGVGGVGSWATTMLVRSGVGKVRVIDFDQVTLSSLNRHAVATLEDVGTPKVRALVKYLARVAPWVDVEARPDLFRKEDADELLGSWLENGQKPDFVIDAIDNIETKADLLAYCHDHSIPVIASMGAGCKSDPSQIFLSDISETTEDPLSRSTRRHLRLRGVKEGIPTVYSTEKPGPGKAQLKPLDDQVYKEGNVEEYSILPDFRARILPVLGTMPAIFGLTLVTHVLTTIAGYPTEPIRGKNRKSLYESAFRDLSKTVDGNERLPITIDDVAFLIEELAGGRSILPPHYPQRLTMVKFDPVKSLDISNVLVVTKDEAKKHQKHVLQEGKSIDSLYNSAELMAIHTALQRFAQLQQYRQP